LFVLTIAATVSLLPSLLPASQPGPTGALSATSDRIAQEVVTNETTAVPGEATGLDADGMKQLATLSESQLRDRFAIRTTWQVNLTVESLDGSRVVTDAGGTPLTAGSTYDGDSGAEEIRIVTVNNDTYAGCTPACRLVVRVW
jgi:autotransporter translocation and assembly factor TamB